MDDFGSRLRGGDESFKMGLVRGGSAGGSGSYRDLSYASPTTPWDLRLAFVDESATPSIMGPTYRSDTVCESIPHACTGTRDGEYVS
jgi:hypothetical protein